VGQTWIGIDDTQVLVWWSYGSRTVSESRRSDIRILTTETQRAQRKAHQNISVISVPLWWILMGHWRACRRSYETWANS